MRNMTTTRTEAELEWAKHFYTVCPEKMHILQCCPLSYLTTITYAPGNKKCTFTGNGIFESKT